MTSSERIGTHRRGTSLWLVWLLLLCCLEQNIALAQGYPGANPTSAHPLDWCTTSVPPGAIFEKPVDLVMVAHTACDEEAAANSSSAYTTYWTTCYPIPESLTSTYYAASLSIYRDIYTRRNSDGVIVNQDSGTFAGAGCGCNDSRNTNLVGIGADAKCYCREGYDWDTSAQSCVVPQYYVTGKADPASQCGPTNACMGEPINPVSGAVFDVVSDIPSNDLSAFKRFYNSTDSGNTDLSGGWRHLYSRSIRANKNSVSLRPYVASSDTSSLFAAPDSACTGGFAQIKSVVNTWANVIATYSDGVCALFQGGIYSGRLAVFSPTSSLTNANPISFDAARDDGQLISFVISGGNVVSPAGINLKLQQTSTGYLLTDANDNAESYDTNGKLQSIASRSGVIQTMSYDSSSRLSSVADNFGHSLSLNYDGQGRLSAVVRQ